MNSRLRSCLFFCQLLLIGSLTVPAFAQVMTKAQVSDVIKRVEDGVDDFQDYREKRGEDARDKASTPEAQSRRAQRGSRGTAPSEERKALARDNKDELEEAMDDLEKATDRLRRRFRRAGNYGSEVARLWAALRKGINDLARVYGVTPLAV